MLLSKGFEIEVYTGTDEGAIVGLSDKIVGTIPGFVREPDSRNVEYTTAPSYRYERSLLDLLTPRRDLRKHLKTLGDYTLVPGSTLPLSGADRFWRSDPGNPYHTYIEQTYGTDVVTASVHINLGISDPELLMRACRLVRVEAPLYLALSAASPFFNGKVTGFHSRRWALFPKTPAQVPLFTSHAHFIQWTEEQLKLGTMQNVRHLWSSVRPNGDRRPYNLNRLELRICDLISNPVDLLAVTALLESRLAQMLADPGIDPLLQSILSPEELAELSDANEQAAAKDSLNAQLRHWEDGRTISARDWIDSIYKDVKATAKANGISCFLTPIPRILREGNEAMRWLRQIESGMTPLQVVQGAITAMYQEEMLLQGDLCQSA
jgi:predicted glutamate--cysteine ligase